MLILEFGPVALFARSHPDVTRWIYSGASASRFLGRPVRPFGLAPFAELLRLTGRRGADFVACHMPAERLRRLGLPGLAYEVLCRRSALPIIGLDFNDRVPLTPTALRLLDRCAVYFKREMPLERDELVGPDSRNVLHVLHRNQGKLRPISLGLAAWRIADLPKPLPPKSVDVFFAGAIQTDLRRRGAALLAVLHRSGVTVDFVEGHLDRAEYLSRMARAHLAWSPEGLGWQCFRHFEAAVAGAIPVINRQRIEMRHPLRAGEHAFYYDPDGEDLIGVIRHALADKQRLRGMADAARQYVLAHHTHQSVAGEILDAVREISDGISEGR